MDTHARDNIRVTIASVAVAGILTIAKLWALGATGSLSVAASLADSALDLMMSLAGLAAVIYAARPADEDHTFGHTSIEDLAGLAQSCVILTASAMIAVAAVRRLIGASTGTIAAEGQGMAVMVLSIVLTLALVTWQARVAAATGSKVVAADRLHYLGDLIPNVGALVSLWASAQFGLGMIDGIVGLAAAVMLATGALRIGAGAWNALMDRAVEPEIVAEIERIAGSAAGIAGFHDLKTRRAGSRFFVNLHVEIDGRLPLEDAHEIAAEVVRAILRTFPKAEVIIHMDPVRDRPRAG